MQSAQAELQFEFNTAPENEDDEFAFHMDDFVKYALYQSEDFSKHAQFSLQLKADVKITNNSTKF